MHSSPAFVSLVFVVTAAAAVFQPARSAVPGQSLRPEFGGDAAAAVSWSVLDDCFGDGRGLESVTVCLKCKALAALDRTLSKPTLALADGVSLTVRTGKSQRFDAAAALRMDRAADLRAALDAAAGRPDRENALLDDLLASRVHELVSTRAIAMDDNDGPAGEEGRGKKKKDKTVKQAIMMAVIMAVAVLGPMMIKIIGLIAIKALLVSKVALILSGFMTIKKLMSQKKQSTSHETEPVVHHYDRSMQEDTHEMAYSGQTE